MKCSHCGKEVPENARGCGYCGTPVAQPAAETPKPAPQKAVPEPEVPAKKAPVKKTEVKTRKLPKWALPAGLGAAALVLVVVLFATKSPSQPQTAAEAPQEPSAPQVEEAPAVTELELLGGTWKGEIENKQEGFTVEITFDFPDDCALNTYCGSINVPEFSLVSDVKITSINGSDYEFILEINEGLPEDELDFSYLKYINPNQLGFYSEGDTGDTQGTLYKQ